MNFDPELLQQCEKLGIDLNTDIEQIVEEETTYMVLDLAVTGLPVKQANQLFEQTKAELYKRGSDGNAR